MEDTVDDATIVSWYRQLKSTRSVAKILGITRHRVRTALARMNGGIDITRRTDRVLSRGFTREPIPPKVMPLDELFAKRRRENSHNQKHEDAKKLIKVSVNFDGPYAVFVAGDPHLDDDAVSLDKVLDDVNVVLQTPQMFGINIGDSSNNWTGKLAKLYGQQSTTAKESIELLKWYMKVIDWVLVIGGNHDEWSGNNNPIPHFLSSPEVYQPHAARLKFTSPNGRDIYMNARHHWPGSSAIVPNFGQMKAAKTGTRDHIHIGGHKHDSAYTNFKEPHSGRVLHCAQLASYEKYSDYGVEKGYDNGAITESGTFVIDPRREDSDPELIHFFWDINAAAEHLQNIRKSGGYQ